MSQGERRLAAIMFTDIVGYTTISQRDESTALQLLDEHRRLVRPFFERHHGIEIKTTGDGFLVEFPSALEAVRCAFDMQQSLNELNVSKPAERRMLARIGIHLGDVVHSQSDVYGDAVNIASRIYPLADAGGICVTSQVYDQIRNKFEFPMATLGKRPLKNVGEATEVFRVLLPWTREGGPKSPVLGHRVAVLPFTNMSPDPNDEYFADGMTEEVISTMSRIEGIDVISRTSVMQYKKSPKPIRDVSRELEVGTVLEGSVRKAGNKLRVTVQMIDAVKDRHVWAESYDRDMQDVFSIQSDIAKRVADALEARMSKEAVAPPEPKEDVEAYTTYMRAMQLLHENTQQSLEEAIILFHHAIDRDPAFSRAYAGLSSTLCACATLGYKDFTIVAEAEAAAKKALELGPEEAEAHSAMSQVHSFLDRFEESVAEARQTIQLNPNLAEAHLGLAVNYATWARLDEALESARRAFDLDPLSYRPRYMLGWLTLMAGRDAEALEILTSLQKVNPRNPRSWTSLCEYYMLKEDYLRAEQSLDAAAKLSPSDPVVRVDRGLLYAFTGRRKEAEEVRRDIMKGDSESVRLYGSLSIDCALGNLDEAFETLMRMTETHSWPFLINVAPLFRGLRSDPRYTEFLRRVGIPLEAGQRLR